MKKILLLFIVIISIIQITQAQDEGISQNEKKGFIIIYATKNYQLASRVAEEANKNLGYKIDMRDLEYNKEIGLSIPKKDCEEHGFEYPSYIQRGRGDDGNFISVEYTNAYNNFTHGYYIVVVATYTKGKTEDIKKTLTEVKKSYEDAYIKYTDVYMGCLH